MEFAVQIRAGWDDVVTAASWAEQRGLAAFAMPDHYLQVGKDPSKPAWDHLVHLAALARETASIELVSLLSPVTFRHPAVHYKIAVTLDEVSDGRFTLGLGTGWMDEEFELYGIPYPSLSTRYEMLEESLIYLRSALAGAGGFSGSHYTLADFDPAPKPKRLRLLVGGSGAHKTPRLAGLYADEFNIYACGPDAYRAKAEKAQSHAAAAGRESDSLFLSSAGPAVAARTKSDYARLLEGMAKLTGRHAETIETTWNERQWPHGWGSQPVEMLEALGAAGCRRFYLQMFSARRDDYDVILEGYGGA